MKAEKYIPPPSPPPFTPVILTLETQEEVNGIFAVLNHWPLCNALGLPDNAWHAVKPFAKDTQKLHANIQNLNK